MLQENENFKWRTGRYCIYKTFVHLIFVTKYRRGVFSSEMVAVLAQVFRETCEQMDCELIEFNGEDDHVHLMLSYPPQRALAHVVGKLKGKSSYVLRRDFWPDLKKKLWGAHLWSPSYCAVSCGGAPLDVVKAYIENQRTPPSKNAVRQSLQETGRKGEKSRVRKGQRA